MEISDSTLSEGLVDSPENLMMPMDLIAEKCMCT